MTVSSADDLRAKIREVPDFPKPGILFYDITTLLKDPDAFRQVIDRMADQVKDSSVDLVVGMESRGFIFSAPLAYAPPGTAHAHPPGPGFPTHAPSVYTTVGSLEAALTRRRSPPSRLFHVGARQV